MYASLLLPFSPIPTASAAETLYRTSHLIRTKGTIFVLPPPTPVLISTFNTPRRPNSLLSAGAVALCKHFERGGSSEHGLAHPFWALPVGSNEAKNRVAETILLEMLKETDQKGAWRNVMLLHPGVAVYEVRNRAGWGMRWTLEVERDGSEEEWGEGEGWRITKTTFRGFVEPIEGMDHELGEAGAEEGGDEEGGHGE